jgi:Tfp pilus assembly major pilin PilA
VAFKVEIDALDLLKRTKADASVILAFRMTFNNYQQALQVKNSELEVKIQQSIADAEARRVAQLWQDKLTLTNTALAKATSAEVDANNAVNSKGSFASKEAAITVLKEANAAFNVAIQALDSVKRNQADDTVVTGFNDQLQSLREKASALETLVAIEAKRVADLTNWDAQLTLTNTALATATTAVTNAISAMNDDNIDLTSKSTAIEASKQANVAFMSEIQVLELVKRDEADATVITAFNDQHQMLNTQIAALEVALAAAIEAKRAADLVAPWLTQLALTNTAFTTASNAAIEANSVLASTVGFPVKTAAIEASKQANEAFRLAIQALDATTVLAKTLLASIAALLAEVKAVLVNANCVNQCATRSAARLSSIAAASATSSSVICVFSA